MAIVGLSVCALTSMLLLAIATTASATPFPGCKGGTLEGCPGTQNCTTHYLTQNIDHFNWAAPLNNASKTTFQQRFFVNDHYWDKKNNGPVFFYFGNEDNVELYVNHTGLMWESAASFGALLIFGEHRYYGKSLPYSPGTPGCMSYLTTEQAMADFAYLIDHLRTNSTWGAKDSAFIGFGGSYGGMLGSWFRVHYPNAIDGVIAASAPIWSFVGLDPPYDYNSFNIGVTNDASASGGSTDRCKTNLKAAWPRILARGKTAAGRTLISTAFKMCKPLQTADDAMDVVQWAEGPWGTMAMGNYPYASSYLMHGDSLLPPWPVRTACDHLANVDPMNNTDEELFEAVREAVAVYHNNTGTAKCFPILRDHAEGEPPRRRFMTSSPPRYYPPLLAKHANGPARGHECTGDWDYQWCTEMTQPFTQGTSNDFFYCPPHVNCSAWSVDGPSKSCKYNWGVTPRAEWARVALGGKRIEDASNIVFSNGLLDPWHGGGILRNLSSTVLAILLPSGAHHIDLMFSDPADAKYVDIGWAREFEREQMRRWVKEHKEKRERKSEL